MKGGATPHGFQPRRGSRRPRRTDDRSKTPHRHGRPQVMSATPYNHIPARPAPRERAAGERAWRDWMMVALGLVAVVTLIAAIVSTIALARSGDTAARTVAPAAAAHPATPPAGEAAGAPTL